MHFTTPQFGVEQDADSLRVRIGCEEARVRFMLIQASAARAAADGTTFGCYMDPVYLPYVTTLMQPQVSRAGTRP